MQQEQTAAQVLAEFAKTAPGRLPQRVQDAIATVDATISDEHLVRLDIKAGLDDAAERQPHEPCGSCKKPWICEQRGCTDKARSEPAPALR